MKNYIYFCQKKNHNMINKNTKISKILSLNEKAIDVIASINKNFRKLKNPILRKIFAPRVTVKDAAKIGSCTINNILEKLETIGFEVEYEEEDVSKNIIKTKLINMKKRKIVKLDVRPILESGVDPYQAIMSSLKELNNDESLLLINSFEPVPLLNKLKKLAYEYEVERPEPQLVYTYLTKTENVIAEQDGSLTKANSELNFEEALLKFKGKMLEVDVRPLEMPMPMVTILEEIEKIEKNGALYVHHKRLPQYLLPELEDRGYIYVNKEIDENNIKFIIYKK